ncbi:MAG: methyltransferase [Planctomycetia bacterium]|nr:methyltransferase [Planctomycetia bacterium]
MSLPAIEHLLQQKMGLHSSTVGSGTISQAVEQRMRSCDITGIDDYLNIISHSATELSALIDTVVIPETWFFRDQHPFSAFSDWLRRDWLAGNPGSPLRILSVPCSTGEEPYTLAMCLADCGIAASDAQIDAIDISSINIEKARSACYSNNSFRGTDLRFRDCYFDPVGTHFQLRDTIRDRVHFQQVNILDPSFIEARAHYHVVFCRNLLIYFDRPTQHQAINRLEQLMTRNGILFLGHSETSLLLERPFTALDYPRSFGFSRSEYGADKETIDAPQTLRQNPRRRHQPARREQNEPLPFSTVTREYTPATDASNSALPAGDLMQQAFQLADQGHLDEAASHCTTLLRQQEQRADAYYLLGLIREAAGNVGEAEQMFRNSIYLDPDHYESLTHLSILSRQQGDSDSAQRFRERAARAQQRREEIGA